MRRLSLLVFALLASLSSTARADEPVPHKPGDKVPLAIVVDDKAAPAKLTIPKELVATMKASLDNYSGDSYAGTSMPTVAAGLSLSLALAFGGVWLVRNRTSPGMKNLVLLIGAFTLLVFAGANVFADFSPLKKRPAVPANELVVVTVVDREGAPITLTVTKEKLAKAIEAAAKPEPK